jgi:hypothetical protein
LNPLRRSSRTLAKTPPLPATGYRMKPDIQPMLNSADAAMEAGEYKKAFNLYRGAYRHITVKSREGLR